MTPFHRATWAPVAVAALLAAGMPASAQLSVTGNGPYFAMPSWSQKLTKNRFVVLADWNHEAVLDRETGLVWERTPVAPQAVWSESGFLCNERTTGGRKGWRLPGLQDMMSLIDPAVPHPGVALPPGHPFELPSPLPQYWTATTSGQGHFAWYIEFPRGITASSALLDMRGAWCVRGGSAADNQ